MSNKFGKLIKETTLVVRFTDNAVILSDLSLAVIVESCIDGAVCERAIPDEHNPSRFLFEVKGNVTEMKEFIDAWFGGKKEFVKGKMKEQADGLRKFTSRVSFFKLLIDKARVKIVDERTKEVEEKGA